tara:strand:+ start:660 stop:1169 length:510 start_codon:yes stop_codon:yes gene_type:complete
MDFNKFDSQAIAEAGTAMQILDEWTNEPMMDGDKPCKVILRGTASASMQAKMRAAQKAAMMSKKAKGKDDEDDARVMEDVHNQMCEAAAPFIMGFENVNNGDKPATAADAIWFLKLTFPHMGVKEDENGDPVLNKDDDPVYEMKNNPFAKQCSEFASKQANRLGNVKGG